LRAGARNTPADKTIKRRQKEPHLKIRPFKDSDKNALSKIYLETRQQTFPWMQTFQQDDFTKDTEGELILVAEKDSTPVGFISIWMQDNFIHNLFIDSKYQNLGIGKKLLTYGLSQTGRPSRLKCVIQNKNAVRFYQSNGWKIESQGDDVMGPYYLFAYE
jgi:ribosomal protein S18 acetylase RimI-like enzyme